MLAALVVLLRTLGLLCRGHRAIALENVALRQQLSIFRRTVKRPHLRTSDRVFWVLLAKAWQDWGTALIVVQPDTVVRWHRQWLRRRWAQRSTRTRPGRPSTTAAIRTLVDQMTEANPLWGAPRIHGELGTLGIAVSERTVSRLLGRRRRPPSQTWHTFLTNHVASLVSMDFYRADAHWPRAVRARAPHPPPPPNRSPGGHRTSQRRVDGATDHRGLSERHRAAVAAAGSRCHLRGRIPPPCRRHGHHGGHHQSLKSLAKSVCGETDRIHSARVDHVIVLGERHLRRLLTANLTYYHGARTHLALEKDAPTTRRVQTPPEGPVVAFPEVGGLHHRYERRAA